MRYATINNKKGSSKMKNYQANRELLEILESQKIKIKNLKEEVKILQRKLDQQIAKERVIKQ
ncbi:hypothetical protein [Apilactobacillus kunkeei]|uniref:hypothetical protein n=1 Tax=Apilactobacillus kunkeei TaxID=148814 RepID=UPI0033655270